MTSVELGILGENELLIQRTLIQRNFRGGDVRIIPLDGVLTEIIIEEINDDGEVVVSVRRR